VAKLRRNAAVAESVAVILLNGEGAEHDIAFPTQNVRSSRVTGRGASTTIALVSFRVIATIFECAR
jgi:hypothetical protein